MKIKINHDDIIKNSRLGQNTEYKSRYDPQLLLGVPRKTNRQTLGLQNDQPPPFQGYDVWHAYELSWLNLKGKPIVALARFVFNHDSCNIIESKSFKLYLNSFNQTQFADHQQVVQRLTQDLSHCAAGEVIVTLFSPDQFAEFTPQALPGVCLDDADIQINQYQLEPSLLALQNNAKKLPHQKQVFHSHLLKSNCLITNQPDWGSIVIDYEGPILDENALLRYLISFRQHNEFHEHCVERIYTDIWQLADADYLSVVAYYTRRGGLDITPYRCSNGSNNQLFDFKRINRQ